MVAFGIVQGFQTQIHNSDSLMSAMQLQTTIVDARLTSPGDLVCKQLERRMLAQLLLPLTLLRVLCSLSV